MEHRRSYLIIGGAGGIGAALTRTLVQGGNQVTIAGRDQTRLRTLATQVDVGTHVVDAADPEMVEAAVGATIERAGRIDGIVNLAGSILLKPAHLTSDAEWDEVMDLNLRTAFNVTRSAGRHLRKHGGAVVLMSSAAASVGLHNHEAIAAAKAGVEGMVRAAAATYARWQIRFNAVAPGLVRTPMSARLTGSEAALEVSNAMHALGRIGEPYDVVDAIRLALESDWMTGQVIRVDGGLAAVRPQVRRRG